MYSSNLQRGGPIEVHCVQCLVMFMSFKSRITDGRSRFCSRNCSSEWKRINYHGRPGILRLAEANPNWRGRRRERGCPICEKSFSKPGKTCSIGCGRILRSRTISGPNNPFARKHPARIRICARCNKTYSRNLSTRGLGKSYCSLECSYQSLGTSLRAVALIRAVRGLGYHVTPERSWPWLVSPHSKQRMRVDLYVPKLRLAIEYDGRHHREAAAFGNGQEKLRKIQERDIRKDQLLHSHGISVLRISTWPVDIADILFPYVL